MRTMVVSLGLSLALLSIPGAVAASGPRPATVQCGEWRWPVKTLSDKLESKVNFFPRNRTAAFLRGLHAPAHLIGTTPRQKGVEMTTYRIQVALIRATIEDDHDIHLVVATPTNHAQTMIVEFPDTNCSGAAGSKKKAQMHSARDTVLSDCPPIGSSKSTPSSPAPLPSPASGSGTRSTASPASPPTGSSCTRP